MLVLLLLAFDRCIRLVVAWTFVALDHDCLGVVTSSNDPRARMDSEDEENRPQDFACIGQELAGT